MFREKVYYLNIIITSETIERDCHVNRLTWFILSNKIQKIRRISTKSFFGRADKFFVTILPTQVFIFSTKKTEISIIVYYVWPLLSYKTVE